MEKMSREEARKLGSNKYFTGQPCKHGHVAMRYTKTCVCCQCHLIANSKDLVRSSLVDQGIRQFTALLHQDDHAALQDYVNLLNAQRGLFPSVPNVAAAATPASSALALWSKVHGPDIAMQLADLHR